LRGDEHREWHNLYGMLFHRSTGEGQIRRNKGENIRPFVLSRSFFAGTQKYGAIWTGDNAAEWSHLEIATPMLLGLNVGAISFVGADVGGFFGNTDAELMTRWMQAGSYTPFFRGHAHHDAKRREPWMFGEETMVRLRKAAMSRYALLPYWYTVFAEAGRTGMPIMRYVVAPSTFALHKQWLYSRSLPAF
jgi:alpha 1,3-glucosidase